jgi:single-stranded-DNA-specific exonuclease
MIVTDHHEPLFEEKDGERSFYLPQADVLVNPKQPGCPYPYKKLCGGAVAWKVVCELYRICGVPSIEADHLLAFAAFATVGDVMDLDGENRTLVKAGLYRLHNTDNQGLLALARVNNLDIRTISSYHIGFVLGPCINASGRLDTAKRSMRLLLAETEEEAMTLATELKELNEERKLLTAQAVEEACRRIEEGEGASDRVLVVYLPHCHESIAGIVAGRLRERYYRPTFVVTDAETSAKGSGRSIEGYSMFEEMVRCGDLFLKFGGHPMAAGFSLEKERIDEMRRRLNENCTLTEEDLMEKISIDVPMPIDYITEELVDELSLLEPFGKGNEKPLFAEAKLKALSALVLGKNANVLKLRVMNRAGKVMDALYFGDPEVVRTYLTEKYGPSRVQDLFWGRGEGLEMDLTYYPSVNEYKGQKSLQIVIKNYR